MQTHFRVFWGKVGGGWLGVKCNACLKYVLSLCNEISTSTFDLRLALLVPPQSEIASYAPEGTCRQVLQSTLVDSLRFESINIFRVEIY